MKEMSIRVIVKPQEFFDKLSQEHGKEIEILPDIDNKCLYVTQNTFDQMEKARSEIE